MTVFIPTTRVSIHRGEATDEYGDPVQADSPIWTGVPVAISQGRNTEQELTSQTAFTPADQRLTTITNYIIRMRPGEDVQIRDRLEDDSGNWYQVMEINSLPSLIGAADIRIVAIGIS